MCYTVHEGVHDYYKSVIDTNPTLPSLPATDNLTCTQRVVKSWRVSPAILNTAKSSYQTFLTLWLSQQVSVIGALLSWIRDKNSMHTTDRIVRVVIDTAGSWNVEIDTSQVISHSWCKENRGSNRWRENSLMHSSWHERIDEDSNDIRTKALALKSLED